MFEDSIVISTNLDAGMSIPDTAAVSAETWAKKYVQQLDEHQLAADQIQPKDIAQRLSHELRPLALEGWKQTEKLLAGEMVRHQIDPKLLDPWDISKDAYTLFEKALQGYADQIALPRLAVQLADDISAVRHRYTESDPRVIGFASMQFFYTGQNILNLLSEAQRSQVSAYFNVITDYLYMPLKRAFSAAGKHTSSSPQLQIVRKLMPVNTEIAHAVVKQTLESQSTYRCHHGFLSDSAIQISSIRDVEMFQIYLWVCILEGNLRSIQDELFPLCVMLYPRLRVGWELVRQMLFLIGKEFQTSLTAEEIKSIQPYSQALWEMFSPQVFPEIVTW